MRDVTGYNVPLPLATFGLFVALGALVAGACFRTELQRLYQAGRIGPAQRRGVPVPPQEVVSDFMVVVLIAGVVGARLFHILEHTGQFMADPMSMIFTRSGLSIFGGLIAGTLAGMLCVRRWRLPVRPLLDAAAPAMMIGYAVGRIGCQVSGDGDWGTAANMALKPDWLPAWFWAQTYDNNIFGEVIAAPGVYPAPIYETAMATVCFLMLWALRRHPFRTGWLFSVYLILAGVERLLIEQIRVNPVFDVLGMRATQAEMIAVVLIVLGVAGALLLGQRQAADGKLLNPG
ncbi:prolipoprotein diacylglyceryl transferase [Duganella sp. CF517]|uniref:prolipoprotein diacylglyceryl transferase n=1 Tax=Duganella sp. CF517 TaxID=1881038 RepID=UPI001E2A3194|nr:prolipoprotein diacylglyceryl transferase [Duganella sp. CF517]